MSTSGGFLTASTVSFAIKRETGAEAPVSGLKLSDAIGRFDRPRLVRLPPHPGAGIACAEPARAEGLRESLNALAKDVTKD